MAEPKVKIEFINPFVRAVTSSLETMVYTKVERVGLYVKKEDQTKMGGDISVLMSVFGGLNGTVVLTYPRKVAIKLVGAMLMDEEMDDFDDDVSDGIGEIGNLVVGSAKSAISQAFKCDASVSIPTILTGQPHYLQHQKGVPCIGCVFNSPHGKFSLEVALLPDEELNRLA
ncbi:MAG: chemotaxis protein CheX [Planctomycetes bacterium]|nr:chemotaxis protein CheX [Planctomycetota bacterium]